MPICISISDNFYCCSTSKKSKKGSKAISISMSMSMSLSDYFYWCGTSDKSKKGSLLFLIGVIPRQSYKRISHLSRSDDMSSLIPNITLFDTWTTVKRLSTPFGVQPTSQSYLMYDRLFVYKNHTYNLYCINSFHVMSLILLLQHKRRVFRSSSLPRKTNIFKFYCLSSFVICLQLEIYSTRTICTKVILQCHGNRKLKIEFSCSSSISGRNQPKTIIRLLLQFMSCVMCHVSCVMCHVSCVMCHVSYVHVSCHVMPCHAM